MPPINFSTTFSQNKLVKYIHSDKKNITHIIDKLSHVSNINDSQKGLCLGLSHQYIAYENNHQGTQFIQQLNSVIAPAKWNVPSYDPIQRANNQAWKQISTQVAQQHAIDVIRLQSNHIQSIYYLRQIDKLNSPQLARKYPYETNLEYIDYCLTTLKDEVNLEQSYGINIDNERNLINQLYKNLECNQEITHPRFFVCSPLEIYKKINRGNELTEEETKLFLQDAYRYCALTYEFNSALFNVKSGLKYNKTQPEFSYENIYHVTLTETQQQIENHIDTIIQNQQDCSMFHAAKGHATAITIKYDPLNKRHSFSYFDPNKGVITLSSKEDLFEVIRQIPKDTDVTKDDKTIETAYIKSFYPTDNSSKKIRLPSLEQEAAKITKQLLVERKTSVTLSNRNTLSFIDYDAKSDLLILALKIGKECYQIISEYGNINETIKLIESTKSEYANYQSKNIYIDWKGRIANKIALN